MKKAIILARVSTKQQEESGLSIEKIQLPQMKEYAKNNGLEVAKEHEFVFQETASQKLRKNFDEVIKLVKENEDIEAIIAFRVDRMTRNYRDAVEMDTLRTEYNKELHFVSDKLVLDEKSVGRDIQDWDLKVFLAKQHINRCQEDAQNTLNSKLTAGEMYGLAPYGYENVEMEDGSRGVAIKPFEGGIVKQIFDLYTSRAYSYSQIVEKINKEHNQKFYISKIEKLFNNKFYIGIMEFKGKEYPHKYERIVTSEVFDLAQDIKDNRNRLKSKRKLKGKHAIYQGILSCEECGCAFSPTPRTKTQKNGNVHKWVYYYCTNSKGLHDKRPKGIEEKEMTKQFAELFKQMQIPKKELDWLTEALIGSHEGKKKFTETEINTCNKEIKRYERMIENAYEDKCASSITQDEYDKVYKQWRTKQTKWKEKLDRILKADDEYYITATMLLELASRSYELFMGSEPEQKREIIQLTLRNLTLKDGKLCYEWIKPFDSIFESTSSLNWGG